MLCSPLIASKPVLSSSKPLNVRVSVSESEDMVASAEEGAQTVSFAVGADTAKLLVPTVDDGVAESNSVVTAAVQNGRGLHGRHAVLEHGDGARRRGPSPAPRPASRPPRAIMW